ncbi:hypothetical protein [Streptomyces sp. NPDC088801]|uniref:hypothetical protein n=1 Tax=Streptomyces sp. NPDC088801 TaxID=3365903 RepID=UPI00380A7C24
MTDSAAQPGTVTYGTATGRRVRAATVLGSTMRFPDATAVNVGVARAGSGGGFARQPTASAELPCRERGCSSVGPGLTDVLAACPVAGLLHDHQALPADELAAQAAGAVVALVDVGSADVVCTMRAEAARLLRAFAASRQAPRPGPWHCPTAAHFSMTDAPELVAYGRHRHPTRISVKLLLQ